MAKMTKAQLQTFVTNYVSAAKQAGTWNKTADNLAGLLDKVGKIVTLDGNYNDFLSVLNGDDLPLGKTIEEYFIDLTLPSDFDAAGATDTAPALPTIEAVAYSYTLGRKKIKTTVPFDNVERAANTATDASNMITKIMDNLQNSQSMYTYAIKKQLLANAISKATTASAANLVSTLAAPTNTATGEAFIKAVKKCVEDARFPSETNNIGQYLCGAAPSLTLFIKKGVMPSVEVDTLAGAFNQDKLGFGVDVVVVDDFGNDASNAYCILADTRGIKLHNSYRAIRSRENADGDFINYVLHTEYTGFISKSTYIHVFKSA